MTIQSHQNKHSQIFSIILQISDKGYITFDTPYYSQTMTTSAFRQIYNQAIAAPFWADLLYDNVSSLFPSMTLLSHKYNEHQLSRLIPP
jgi:hypothetical protein